MCVREAWETYEGLMRWPWSKTEAEAAEAALAHYRAALGDGYAGLYLFDADGIDFVAELFPRLDYGSSQWQVWADPEEWEVWFTEHEASPEAELARVAEFAAQQLAKADPEGARRKRNERQEALAPQLSLAEIEAKRAELAPRLAAREAERIAEEAWRAEDIDNRYSTREAWEHGQQVAIDRLNFQASDDGLSRERLVLERMASLEIDQEARRRVAAKNYDGLGGLLSWSELEDMAALSWLVPGWIPMGETAFLVAKRNLGKSMFALALGFSVALGMDFLGQPTTQGKVLFVLGEGSRGFMKRLKAWALGNGVPWEDLRDLVGVYRGGKLNNDQSLADMTEAVRQLDPVLVVFDTYSSLSGVVNEIDAAENAEVLNRIKRIAPEAATLILAHPNAETESTTAPKLRGTTVLSSNVDTVITMFRDKGHVVAGMPFDDWLAISTAEAHAGKQKDDSNQTLHGLAVLVNAEGAYLDYHDAAGLTKADAWVRSNMPLGVMVTVNDLIASSGASRNTVRTHLKASSLVTEWPSPTHGPSEYRRNA